MHSIGNQFKFCDAFWHLCKWLKLTEKMCMNTALTTIHWVTDVHMWRSTTFGAQQQFQLIIFLAMPMTWINLHSVGASQQGTICHLKTLVFIAKYYYQTFWVIFINLHVTTDSCICESCNDCLSSMQLPTNCIWWLVWVWLIMKVSPHYHKQRGNEKFLPFSQPRGRSAPSERPLLQ